MKFVTLLPRVVHFLLICCTAALAACATHSPSLATSAVPSPGPNGLHSGVYAAIYTPSGAIIGQVWYEQNRTVYNALIAKYGSNPQFAPALQPDDHLTADGPFWRADGTAIANYISLLELKRQAQAK